LFDDVGASYPYTDPQGTVIITESHPNFSGTQPYTFFYDWKISSGSSCDRVPVIAEIGGCSEDIDCSAREIVVKPTATVNVSDECTIGQWQHYFDENGNIIFSIDQGANDHDFEVDVNVSPLINENNGVSAGTFIMGRQWNVDVVGGAVDFTSPVSVRFYYDANEMQELIDVANDFKNNAPDPIEISDVKWFKTTKGVDFDNSMVTHDGLDQSTIIELLSVSAETTVSGNIRFVQIDSIFSFSGGSAFISTNPMVLDIGDIAEDLALKNLESIQISPNPTQSNFRVALKDIDAFDYESSDVTFGDDLASGVYYLTINNGIKSTTRSLVKF